MLTLSVIREGKLTEIPNIEIGEYSASVAAAQEPSSPAANFQDDRLGIFVGNLTPQLRQGLKLQADKGVVITGVKGNSIAGWAGLRKGMVILSVNHQPVDNVEQYQQALQKVAKDKPILFLLKDGEFTRYVSFKVNG
jgi:serine protease Do